MATVLVNLGVLALEAEFSAPRRVVDCRVFNSEAVEDLIRREQAEALDHVRPEAHRLRHGGGWRKIILLIARLDD